MERLCVNGGQRQRTTRRTIVGDCLQMTGDMIAAG